MKSKIHEIQEKNKITYIDVTAPILLGKIGTIHVGMDARLIEKNYN